tara:strand:+ start:126 stop:638 length:513 start_codon:yes stop_codon:yes gene_type:complete
MDFSILSNYLPILLFQILFAFLTYRLSVKKGYNKYVGMFMGFFLQLGGLIIMAILPKKIKSDNWEDKIKYNKSLSIRLFGLGVLFFIGAAFSLYEAIFNGGELETVIIIFFLGIITIIIAVKKDPTPAKLDPDAGKKIYQALGKCYSCQKKVSSMATKCPHCLVELPTII